MVCRPAECSSGIRRHLALRRAEHGKEGVVLPFIWLAFIHLRAERLLRLGGRGNSPGHPQGGGVPPPPKCVHELGRILRIGEDARGDDERQ
jgi:hypothetical protein